MITYHKCNFVVLTALTCAANIEQTVTPWFILVYIIFDTCVMLIYPNIQKNIARRNQMIAHHICVAILSMTVALGGIAPYNHMFAWFVNLEISSLLLLARRLWKLKVPYVTEIAWVLSRLIYLPRVLYIVDRTEFPNISPHVEYTGRFVVWYIFFIGVVWSMEMVHVHVNPLVITAVASFMPIRHLIHIPLTITSVLHHMWWSIGNVYHVIDSCMVRIYVVWGVYTCWGSPLFWICMLTACRLGTWTRHVTDRTWDNMYNLIPHALSHYIAGLGVYIALKQ